MKSYVSPEIRQLVRETERQYNIAQLVRECCSKMRINANELFEQVCIYLQGEHQSYTLSAQKKQFLEKGLVDPFFEKALQQIANGVITISPLS